MNKKKEGEHIAKYIEEPGLIDRCICSCGWKSNPYYDGQEWAEQEFKKHKADPAIRPVVLLKNRKPGK